MTRTIDARTGGVGDLARALWIAEGARSVGETVGVVSGDYRPVTEAFGLVHVDAPTDDCLGLGSGFGPYEEEMRTAAWDKSPSALRWQRTAGWDYPLVRPTYRPTAFPGLPPTPRPIVVIAPRANVGLRSFPAHKWMRVAWDLDARGLHVVAVDRANEDGLDSFPHSQWGYAWDHVLALLARASAVAGNCSGVPNLAATIGIPTVAAMGPTDPRIIFGHCPETVTPARAREVPCVGCHFQYAAGFRQPCDYGCEALHALRWEAVRDAILEKL